MAQMSNEDFGYSNELFRLRWLEDERLAGNSLSLLAGLASSLKGEGVYEADTAAIFVEPLLRGLGWDTLDHDQVDRARPGMEDPDYELYAKASNHVPKSVAILEVKQLEADELYLRGDAFEQLRKYVLNPLGKPEWVVMEDGRRVVRGAVTNGRWWHVYEFHGDQYNLRCEFDLQSNPDVRGFLESLGRHQLLSRLGL